jgi:chromosome partitioning protein
MKVISIISQKGGVGKTTLATALAVAAERDGKQVALFDLDDQASACFWSDLREAPTPAVKDLKAVRLPVYLQSMREAGCDLVIIDCPPVHKDIALEAAAPADFVLIPTKPDLFDVRSMQLTVNLLSKIGKPAAVVLTFCPPAGPEVPGARDAVAQIGAQLCPVEIGLRKSYARAQQTGLTAQEFDSDGKAASEIAQLYDYTYIQLGMNEVRHDQAKSVASGA